MTLHSEQISPRLGNARCLTPAIAIAQTCEGGHVVRQRQKSWGGVSAQLVEISCGGNLRIGLGTGSTTLCAVLEEVGGRFTVRAKNQCVQDMPHERPRPLSLVTADLEAYGGGDHLRFVRLLLLQFELPAVERLMAGEIDPSNVFTPRLMFDDPSIMRLVQLFAAECANDERYSIRYGDTLSVALLVALSRLSSRKALPIARGRMAPWQIRRVTGHLTTHLTENVGLQTMCGLVQLSRSHFIRAFKKSTGLSPRQWLLHARITKAKELLLTSDRALVAIATDVGFADQAHFGRTFRLVTGETPGAWRRARQ